MTAEASTRARIERPIGRWMALLASVGLLAAARVGQAAEARDDPSVQLDDLATKVGAAARAASLLSAGKAPAAPGASLSPQARRRAEKALTGDWLHERIPLPPAFLQDFPAFAGLDKIAATVEQEAAQVDGGTDLAALATHLEQYRLLLAELAEAVGASSALVVSGGVSLGAYQGGFLHYYTQFLLAHNDAVANRYQLGALAESGGIRVTTGASAGSINAFIAALTSCRAAVLNPRQSLFWSAWIPVGFDTLIDLGAVSFDSVLSSKPIDEAIARLAMLWSQRQELSGWTKACETVIGLSATRLEARDIDFSPPAQAERSDALRLKRQTEKFVLRLVGKPGQAPALGPFRPSPTATDDGDSPIDMVYPTLGQNALGFQGSLETIVNTFEEVATLLKASAAFPIAFPPVPVDLTIWRRVGKNAFVPLEHGPVRFVDGGVFDNTPIGLAVKIEDWLRERRKPVPTQLVFLSSDAIGWSRAPASSANPTEARSLAGTYAPFLRDFITTAEQNELLNTLENRSSIPRNVPARMMPIAGEQLSHFFAFAEQDFRIFDFFMGMVDAREYLASQHPLAVEVLAAANGTKADAQNARPLPVDAREFDCFDEHRRLLRRGAIPDVGRIAACRSVDPNLLALLKASTALRAQAQLGPAGRSITIDDFVRAIEKEGYTYKQLKYHGRPARAATATRALRDDAQNLIYELGWHQPTLENYPVELVGKALANTFEYQAPRWVLRAGALVTGGAELGLTRLWSPGQYFALGPIAFGRLLRWESQPIAHQDGTVTFPIAVTSAANLGPQLEYALGPRLQLDLLGGGELDYVSQREVWHPYYHQWGWFAQVDATLYQRIYLLFEVHGTVADSRSETEIAAVGAGAKCCQYRAGFGFRFFGH